MSFLNDENYISTMNQLMQTLVDKQRKGGADLSPYAPKFYELMQSRADPPLETIWVYSFLHFSNTDFEKIGALALDRLEAIKDLFQFVSACSVSCVGSKSVCLVAPVVFELCKFVAVEFGGRELSSERVRKLLKEVVNLSEVILAYVNACLSGSDEEDGLGGCVASFLDLARVWMCSNGEHESGDLRLFFPLASDEVCREVILGGYNMKQLSGVVTSEAFLLKLLLMFYGGDRRSNLEQEMRDWAVGSISAMQNHYFFEILVKMLLEPTLPLSYFSIAYDEVLFHKVLYDSLVLAEYYFLDFKPHPAERMKRLALTRLVMTYEAVEYFRQSGDQRRAATHTDAFARSKLCSQLIRWMESQFTLNNDATQLNGSSPKAIFKWLLSFENQGNPIFDASMASYRTKLASELAKDDMMDHRAEDGKHSEGDDVFFIDKTGEDMDEETAKENDDESMSAAAAATRKRKDKTKGSKRKGKKAKPSKPIQYQYDHANADKEME